MINISTRQQTIYFTGDIGEYTINGQYLMMDDYITAIDVEVYVNTEQCLGFIHFEKPEFDNGEMRVSYNCDYTELPTLEKFFPILLEEFKLHLPSAFTLDLTDNVSSADTPVEVSEDPTEISETPEASEDSSSAEVSES